MVNPKLPTLVSQVSLLFKMEKLFKAWLVLDWKSGKFKVSSRIPKIKTASQIPTEFDITVVLPEQAQLKADVKVVLSSTKVAEIVAEQI